MDMRYLILSFLILLGGCLPEAKVSKGNSSTQESGPTETIDPTIPKTDTQWNYLAQNYKTITIYASNLNNAYITGYETETYLASESNFKNQTYCLVADFSITGNKRQMRARVIPESYYDFSAKRTVRTLRVDFNVISSEVQSLCSPALYSYNSLGEHSLDTTVPATVVYSADALCPTCTSRVNSTKIRVFKLNSSALYEVPTQSIKLSGLSLIVDPNSGSSGGNGSCSISSCQAQGYDCCLEDQCVDNSALRPSAQTIYYDQWRTAEEERLTDPLAWMRYPHIYYICPNYVPPTTGTTTGGSTGTTTGSTGGGGDQLEQQLAQIKKDLACLENIKAQTLTVPFHQELLVNNSFTGTAQCKTLTSEENDQMHFKKVARRLYQYCGCSYSELADMINFCPAYYYKASTTNSAGEVTSFECQILSEVTVPTTQEVSVNSRSAPHRFFNSDGAEFSTPQASSLPQELDTFTYLDQDNNVHSQSEFGINSIIGPMSINLDRALPAKSVNVELDQMYLIRTTSGYYTPCPTCGKDKWHESMTAYPSSNWGVGLQAIGFSTKRDELDSNITGGNYEDTIFGRACWVPPTMLPFTHRSITGTDSTNQRRNRLQTQAVLYSNGYQRDWFGFNKGALIGSFDGVSWFAVGNGRLVKSTTKKLYLAINAPFADLATASMHQVQISLYDGHSQAPQVDYDPQYHRTASLQNQAGNCQANHMCQTDTDCITRLGWEYACADVSGLKTNWPIFDINSREEVGTQALTLDQILTQKKFPSSDTKRCVYRGAGAVCLQNSNLVTDLNNKKVMTCAPNFYCAPLTSGDNISTKVSRFATDLENLIVNRNHLFGQDANVLGRPLNYMGEIATIPNALQTSIRSNLMENQPTLAGSGAGICRPGKALATLATQATMSNPFEQHKSPDTIKRTDFINQIASCNSALFTVYRHSSCPVIGDSGNYLQFESNTLAVDFNTRASRQNSCGLESISTDAGSLNMSADSLHTFSAFKEIEAKPLSEQIITNKTMVRDACLRRAGAVCHTDLDCSPNKLHAEFAGIKALKFFGNNAEKTYWEESLVCGQGNPKPSIYDQEATLAYDQTQNRCCREIGKDLTTHTTDTPRSHLNALYTPETQGLITATHPGLAANNAKRYSRLTSVEELGAVNRPLLSANTTRNNAGVLTSASNIEVANQWKTLREANSETCCGGGWIRKFSDGGNDWTQKNRLYFDAANFSCLNSRHQILTAPESLAAFYNSVADVRNLINRDYSEYCQDISATDGGCAQYSFASNSTDEGAPAHDPYGVISVNTLNGTFGGSNTDFIFTPFSGDAHQGVTMVYNSTTSGARRNINIRIPSFIPRVSFDTSYAIGANGANTNGISIITSTQSLACVKQDTLSPTSHTDASSCAAGNCCYSFDSSSRILKVVLSAGASAHFKDNQTGIRFNVDLTPFNAFVRTRPANDLYYLSRLGRMELSGVPQISYEALYCNDNADRLVPGLFKSSIMKNSAEFENATNSFIRNGEWQTTSHALNQNPVFAESQFKCCSPLGKTTTNPGNCCSGYGVQVENSNNFTCSLPTGTDLMVYLNPFISNEGLNLTLTESDYNSATGEPLLSSTVVNKIAQIGRNHCEGKKVRQGGAFGNFEPEPQGSRTDASKRIYQIVDSSNDVGQVTNAGATLSSGYNVFNEGYRWNHHLYCTE